MNPFKKSETAAQANQFLNFFAQIGVDYLNLAALVLAADGVEWVMEHGKRARDRDEVDRSLGWAWARNRASANIYCRPARYLPDGSVAEWPVVFLDDLAPQTAAGIVRKYRSLAIETSADNFQVWIVVARPCSELERKNVQRALAAKVGADPKSVSGEHFGRFPGFLNRKPGRLDHKISIWATNSTGPVLDPTPFFSDASVAPSGTPQPQAMAVCPRSYASGTSGTTDESAREFRFALARLSAGRPIDEVIKAVFEHAMARGKHRGSERNTRRYAETTVLKAAQYHRDR